MWKLIRAAIPVQLLEMEMRRGGCEGARHKERPWVKLRPAGPLPSAPGPARGLGREQPRPSPELGEKALCENGASFPPSPFFLFTF